MLLVLVLNLHTLPVVAVVVEMDLLADSLLVVMVVVDKVLINPIVVLWH